MDKIAVIDFGGQYAHLIANRVRRLKVYAEILQPTAPAARLKEFKGVIFSGGPSSVYAKDAPAFNPKLLGSGLPLLGICYGHQLVCHRLKGKVERGKVHEFGAATLDTEAGHPLFRGVKRRTRIWMSHGDEVTVLPPGFRPIGATADCRHAAVADDKRRIYGLQFHPEVTHTPEGLKVLDNFLRLCKVKRGWDMKTYLRSLEKRIREQCRGRKVFLLVSGGVDSSVAFALMNKVLGAKNVVGLHIDNGLMRKDESALIMEYMRQHGFHNLHIRDASDIFLARLKNEVSPEGKRRIIGDTFLDVLAEEVGMFGLDEGKWLMAQGTTYPDTIESGGTKNAALIKTHHNRVPAVMELIKKGLIVEPIAELYKDEVRELGLMLGLSPRLVWRHPFPGPGLGVRLLCHDGKKDALPADLKKQVAGWLRLRGLEGEVLPIRSVGVQGDARTYAHPCLVRTQRPWAELEKISTSLTNEVRAVNRVVVEIGSLQGGYRLVRRRCDRPTLDLLRAADDICTKALFRHRLYRRVWQMPVVLLPLNNDGRPVIVMRPIESSEAMTANFAAIDPDVLWGLWRSLRHIGVGALLYDVTHKPPGTIEWE